MESTYPGVFLALDSVTDDEFIVKVHNANNHTIEDLVYCGTQQIEGPPIFPYTGNTYWGSDTANNFVTLSGGGLAVPMSIGPKQTKEIVIEYNIPTNTNGTYRITGYYLGLPMFSPHPSAGVSAMNGDYTFTVYVVFAGGETFFSHTKRFSSSTTFPPATVSGDGGLLAISRPNISEHELVAGASKFATFRVYNYGVAPAVIESGGGVFFGARSADANTSFCLSDVSISPNTNSGSITIAPGNYIDFNVNWTYKASGIMEIYFGVSYDVSRSFGAYMDGKYETQEYDVFVEPTVSDVSFSFSSNSLPSVGSISYAKADREGLKARYYFTLGEQVTRMRAGLGEWSWWEGLGEEGLPGVYPNPDPVLRTSLVRKLFQASDNQLINPTGGNLGDSYPDDNLTYPMLPAGRYYFEFTKFVDILEGDPYYNDTITERPPRDPRSYENVFHMIHGLNFEWSPQTFSDRYAKYYRIASVEFLGPWMEVVSVDPPLVDGRIQLTSKVNKTNRTSYFDSGRIVIRNSGSTPLIFLPQHLWEYPNFGINPAILFIDNVPVIPPPDFFTEDLEYYFYLDADQSVTLDVVLVPTQYYKKYFNSSEISLSAIGDIDLEFKDPDANPANVPGQGAGYYQAGVGLQSNLILNAFPVPVIDVDPLGPKRFKVSGLNSYDPDANPGTGNGIYSYLWNFSDEDLTLNSGTLELPEIIVKRISNNANTYIGLTVYDIDGDSMSTVAYLAQGSTGWKVGNI